jgi:hypothetical protein
MNKIYLFVDVALDKRAYRLTEVVTTDSFLAREMLLLSDCWLPLIGSLPTDKLNGRKEYYIYDYNEYDSIVRKFGSSAAEADVRISEALNKLIGERIN